MDTNTTEKTAHESTTDWRYANVTAALTRVNDTLIQAELRWISLMQENARLEATLTATRKVISSMQKSMADERAALATERRVIIPVEAPILGTTGSSARWVNGNRVRRARKMLGLKQSQLAAAVGLAQPQVSILERTGWITRVRNDDFDKIIPRLASTLGVSEDSLRTRYDRQSTTSTPGDSNQ